jgi:hypothetical protein
MHTTARQFTRTAALAVLAIALLPTPSPAATLSLTPSVHGQAASTDEENFFINSPANPVYVSWTPNGTPLKERRGVFEFSLAALPAGVTIESAELTFDVAVVNSTSNGSTTFYPSIRFYGYAGNNAIDPADATTLTTSLVTALSIDDLGPWSVPLDVPRLQSILDTAPAALGILAYANSQDMPIALWTAASGSSVAAPRITLTYSGGPPAVPGDFNADGSVDAADLAALHNGFAQQLTGYANGDFNLDGSINADDFALFDRALLQSASPAAPLGTSIPEPASLATCLLAALPLLARRRR